MTIKSERDTPIQQGFEIFTIGVFSISVLEKVEGSSRRGVVELKHN
jgi:hypothetical protein